MESTVLVEVIGVIALGILCLVSAISSWQTRRHVMTVFGEAPLPAQLSPRGYYLWLPEQAPPAAAPPGSSVARALAPAVEPADEPGATAAPAPSPRESFAPVSARPLPAVTPPPARAVRSSQSALAATIAVADRIASANGGDNAEGAATVARPDALPSAASDDFDDENEATKVMNVPTAEELDLDKQRARGRAKTLVSASAGAPSGARREPDVQVIGADTPWTPGDKPGPVVAH
ncbi:MAG: hypothetical protein ACMG6S_33175 [Byssovorax sp.]